MSELEDIGRYHQLREQLSAVVTERNNLLGRCAAILQSAAGNPVSRYNLARRCNFDSASRLFEEARAADQRIAHLLAELEQVAPAAGKSVPTLE
jgi:hypothetical protein